MIELSAMMQGPAAEVVTRAILFRDGLKDFFFLDFANVDWDPVGGGGGGECLL